MVARQISDRIASLVARAEDNLVTPRYRNRYTYRHGNDRVPIDELISPLRYDICVRMDFFRMYAERKGLFDRDFNLLIETSKNHPYFVWFKEINCRKFHPDLLRNERTFNAAFSDRVRQSALLYTSFRDHGFQKHRPLLLYACNRLKRTVSGKIVDRAVYMGDGCHRLALLRLAGQRWLEPEKYVCRTFPKLSPLDNTFDLLEQLSISSTDYFRFLSLGYGGEAHDTKEAFLSYVRSSQSHRYDEVLQVLSQDEKAFAVGRS
jgi:hypothetical protein